LAEGRREPYLALIFSVTSTMIMYPRIGIGQLFIFLLAAGCSSQDSTCSTCPQTEDGQALHMLQRSAAAKVSAMRGEGTSQESAQSDNLPPRMTHTAQDSEAIFKAACAQFIQQNGMAKAVEVFQNLIHAEASIQDKSGAAQAHAHRAAMPWLTPQIDEMPISDLHAYALKSSPGAFALANSMQLKAAQLPATPVNFLQVDSKRRQEPEGEPAGEVAAEGEEEPKEEKKPKEEKSGEASEGEGEEEESELSKAVNEAKIEKTKKKMEEEGEAEGGLSPVPDPSKDNVWLISTQTSYGIVNLYQFVQIMWALIAAMAMVATIFEYVHLNYLGFDWDQPLPPVPGEVSKGWRNMCAGYIWVFRLYFWNPNLDHTRGLQYGGAIVFLMFLESILDTGGTLMLNCWTTAMFANNFKKVALICAVQFVNLTAKVFATSYRNYIKAVMKFEWREVMSMYMAERWCSCHTHYLMQLSSQNRFHRIDNPEQRIQEDCRTVVAQSLEIAENLMRSILTVTMQVPILLMIVPTNMFGRQGLTVPGWPLIIAVLWCLIGGLTTQMLSSVLVGINWLKEREEAYFRDRIGHVKRHSEEIASCNNEPSELEQIGDQYAKLKFLIWKGSLWTKRLTWWWQMYKDTEGKLCFLIFLPSYMAGEIGFGTLVQCSVILVQIVEALDIFTNNYYTFVATWRASTDRILEFVAITEEIEGVGQTAAGLRRKGESLRGNNVLSADFDLVTTPAKEIIWKDLHIDVPKGQKLLISGGDGTGKSSIFRCLSAIWPYFDGGRVTTAPWLEKQKFLPERCCLPAICSVRAALAYPESVNCYTAKDMEDVLRAVGLERLLMEEWYDCQPRGQEEFSDYEYRHRNHHKLEHEALDRCVSWYNSLSPEQLQRLAFAHMLLQKPQLVVMDESLSSVDKQSHASLYGLLDEFLPQGATIVTISHDAASLGPLHDKHLTIQGTGGDRKLVPAKRFM